MERRQSWVEVVHGDGKKRQLLLPFQFQMEIMQWLHTRGFRTEVMAQPGGKYSTELTIHHRPDWLTVPSDKFLLAITFANESRWSSFCQYLDSLNYRNR